MKHHFQSIALNRDYGEGFFNLALCLRDLGRIDEAVGCLGRALALNPDNRRARTELAIALLMRGELEAGLRRLRGAQAPARDADAGLPPAGVGRRRRSQGKRILLYPEQGLSDVLLFVRFARELKRRGATVIVLCQALLKDLLAGADFVDEVVAEGEKLPAFDLHASMVSLPHLCRADFDRRVAEPPISSRRPTSRIKLGRLEKAKLRIGIYWAAMPGQPQDRQRSAPFAAVPGAGRRSRAAGVQPAGRRAPEGHPAVRRRRPGARCRPRHLRLRRGRDRAVAARPADLDRCADRPSRARRWACGPGCCCRSTADWRWQLGGTRAPWYPSARLFRQPKAGDWDSVFAAVQDALEDLKDEISRP